MHVHWKIHWFNFCLQVMDSENKLKENLIECARLREGLEMKCDMLESESVGHNQIMWCETSHFSSMFPCRVCWWCVSLWQGFLFFFLQFSHLVCLHTIPPPPLTSSQAMEELQQAKSTATVLGAQLVEMEKQNLLLEGQLKEQGAKCREVASLRRQLENQRALTQNHEQTAAQRHRECQQSQAELESLQAILSLLHLREVRKNVNTWPHCCPAVYVTCLFSYLKCVKYSRRICSHSILFSFFFTSGFWRLTLHQAVFIASCGLLGNSAPSQPKARYTGKPQSWFVHGFILCLYFQFCFKKSENLNLSGFP